MANARSIDEIIASASTDVSESEPMNDLNSSDPVLVDMDMMLTQQQYNDMMGIGSAKSQNEPENQSRHKRKAKRDEMYRWTSNEIPFRKANGVFTEKQWDEILEAMKEWGNYTCIRFRKAGDQDENFIKFQGGPGCTSFIGNVSRGEHPIKLTAVCRSKGTVLHELGHSLGFFHEQSRPDRDDYVTIIEENILSRSLKRDFRKFNSSVLNTYNVPYDYASIMHYGKKASSRNNKTTIQTRDPAYQDVIGNRAGLSFRDIKLANLMYACNKECDPNIECPGEGFVGKDCNCWCPGSPVLNCAPDSGVTIGTTRPPTVEPTEVACVDRFHDCQTWAEKGLCTGISGLYIKQLCKSACHFC